MVWMLILIHSIKTPPYDGMGGAKMVIGIVEYVALANTDNAVEVDHAVGLLCWWVGWLLVRGKQAKFAVLFNGSYRHFPLDMLATIPVHIPLYEIFLLCYHNSSPLRKFTVLLLLVKKTQRCVAFLE
jgi:hypothetical protein